MTNTYNPNTKEAEAGGSQVGSQPGLHRQDPVSKTIKKKQI
jgi:hypothetical protein